MLVKDSRICRRRSSKPSTTSRAVSGSSGPFHAGALKFGVRWNTMSSDACSAMTGIDWMPDEPVPTTATRLPVKSTPSCGQRPVWWISPANVSAPGASGSFGTERHPVAMITCRAVSSSPVSVVTVHVPAASSSTAAVTRVFSEMSRSRSKRAATCRR